MYSRVHFLLSGLYHISIIHTRPCTMYSGVHFLISGLFHISIIHTRPCTMYSGVHFLISLPIHLSILILVPCTNCVALVEMSCLLASVLVVSLQIQSRYRTGDRLAWSPSSCTTSTLFATNSLVNTESKGQETTNPKNTHDVSTSHGWELGRILHQNNVISNAQRIEC